jgi:hypothetical protein
LLQIEGISPALAVQHGPRDRRLDVAQEQPDMGWSPPALVAAAIRDELLQVSTEARLALDAAAVAGESLEPELIAAIAESALITGAGRAR